MYILSLETSTKNFSLAVSKDEKVLKFRNIRTDQILESSMLGSIEKLIVSAGLTFKKMDAIAVGLGPGSFTSLRVGLSTVKAFVLATNKKVVGVCSLDVIASGVVGEKVDEICVLVDARRGKVYAAVYNVGDDLGVVLNNKGDHTGSPLRKTEYMLTTIDDVLGKVQGKTLFVGDAIALYKKDIEKACRQPIFAAEKFWYPQAKELAKLAEKRLSHQDYDDAATLIPIYLYPQDCQVNSK